MFVGKCKGFWEQVVIYEDLDKVFKIEDLFGEFDGWDKKILFYYWDFYLVLFYESKYYIIFFQNYLGLKDCKVDMVFEFFYSVG